MASVSIRMRSRELRSSVLACVAAGMCALVDAAEPRQIVVAVDGSGDFKTIQEAIAAIPEERTTPTKIRVKAGTYHGPIVIPASKKLVELEGDDPHATIIVWNRNVKDPLPEGADKTNPGTHVKGDGFRADNLTFHNTSGDRGQGLAVRVDADRVIFKSCRFLGWQDTLMANKGRQYFKDCYLEGRVDFIYGDATAVFDRCELHSKNGGYVTAASTPPERPFGFVFLHCKLTGDEVPWTDSSSTASPKIWKLPNAQLGRPWRAHASVAFIECEMGAHIIPTGWNSWGKPENETTARFIEYNSTGPGAQPEKRAPWIKQLNAAEAARITPEFVLAGSDGWSPAAEAER